MNFSKLITLALVAGSVFSVSAMDNVTPRTPARAKKMQEKEEGTLKANPTLAVVVSATPQKPAQSNVIDKLPEFTTEKDRKEFWDNLNPEQRKQALDVLAKRIDKLEKAITTGTPLKSQAKPSAKKTTTSTAKTTTTPYKTPMKSKKN